MVYTPAGAVAKEIVAEVEVTENEVEEYFFDLGADSA